MHEVRGKERAWSRADWLALAALACLSLVMLGTGLSIRSLWGSEGRWGMVVKEMIESGNYFLPTVNGIVYFDKPLLSYWAILPFAWAFGLNESALRIPSVLAGVGTALVTFAIGRRLFGWREGWIASLVLLTTGLFVAWARTASADVLNLFSIWLMLWCFLAGGSEGKLRQLVLMYAIGAVASFLKGPVALAVALFAILFYSSVSTLLEAKNPLAGINASRGQALKSAFLAEFRWLISRQALVGILAGIAIFFFLLLLPVLVTGSWVSAQLMWRENVVRFFAPFDHYEPPYAYVRHILLLSAPWTFFIAAAVWEMRRWEAGRARRWIGLVTVAIFLFFALSGSRRSYYILPLVPVLALLAGRAFSDGLKTVQNRAPWTVRAAALVTAGLMFLAGCAAAGMYATKVDYRTLSVLAVSLCAIGGSGYSLWLLIRGNSKKGLIVVMSLIFVIELWTFNAGMQLAERKRTLKGYCAELAAYLTNVDTANIALYRENAALLFYLNRKNLRELLSIEDLRQFQKEHPDGFVIADLDELDTPEVIDYVGRMTKILVQKTDSNEEGQRFALLRFGPAEKSTSASSEPVSR